MNTFDFIRTAVKNYTVGALTASSKYAVRQVTKEINSGHKYIVEYGAGDGIITREILRKLPPDGKLIAIELNENFIPYLTGIGDPRLLILQDDVVAVSRNFSRLGIPHIDMIISGIPFSFLKPHIRRTLIKDTHQSLREGGIFIVYQYSPLILPLLKEYFGRVNFRLEPRNLFPYFIMCAQKRP